MSSNLSRPSKATAARHENQEQAPVAVPGASTEGNSAKSRRKKVAAPRPKISHPRRCFACGGGCLEAQWICYACQWAGDEHDHPRFGFAPLDGDLPAVVPEHVQQALIAAGWRPPADVLRPLGGGSDGAPPRGGVPRGRRSNLRDLKPGDTIRLKVSKLPCPFCKGQVSFGDDEPVAMHSVPTCPTYDASDATKFLRRVLEQLKMRPIGGSSEPAPRRKPDAGDVVEVITDVGAPWARRRVLGRGGNELAAGFRHESESWKSDDAEGLWWRWPARGDVPTGSSMLCKNPGCSSWSIKGGYCAPHTAHPELRGDVPPARLGAVYIAARYGRRLEALNLRGELEALGVRVTSEWVLGGHDQMPDEDCARVDLRDVDAADTVISLTEAGPSPGRARGGRHVEFGYALAKGKRVILVGPRENVFHHLPDVEQFDTIAELLAVARREVCP